MGATKHQLRTLDALHTPSLRFSPNQAERLTNLPELWCSINRPVTSAMPARPLLIKHGGVPEVPARGIKLAVSLRQVYRHHAHNSHSRRRGFLISVRRPVRAGLNGVVKIPDFPTQLASAPTDRAVGNVDHPVMCASQVQVE